MLCLVSTTRPDARDLGFLLRKHPETVAPIALTFGEATVFWPVATDDRATCALFVEVDPVALVRRAPTDRRPLEPYVNDRPYVGSSFLSVAIAEAFSSALNGRCPERPELVDEPWPLQLEVPAIAPRGGEGLVRSLFEPLGYEVELVARSAGVFGLTLRHTLPVRRALGHLYVLLPVLDDDQHFFVGEAELEKLARHGEGWLDEHPRRDVVVQRYLRHQASLARAALARLSPEGPPHDPLPLDVGERDLESARVPTLNEQRLQWLGETLRSLRVTDVVDLGCGEGKLLARLARMKGFTRLGGVEVSTRSLERAWDRLPADSRLTVWQSSLLYRDERLRGWSAAVCAEVIEHFEPSRLPAFEAAIFDFARPAHLLLTTPNVEYNVCWPIAGRRHPDHRFEWTRAELRGWAQGIASRNGYDVTFHDIGPPDPDLGPPTQAALFRRRSAP